MLGLGSGVLIWILFFDRTVDVKRVSFLELAGDLGGGPGLRLLKYVMSLGLNPALALRSRLRF